MVGFSSGLIGRDGQDTITSDAKRGAKWLPGILSGADILKFVVQPSGAHILYDKSYIKSGYECVDYAAPKLFMRQTGDTMICAFVLRSAALALPRLKMWLDFRAD